MDRLHPQFTQIESSLSGLLRERTGYEVADLDRDATFMELGFDSLFLIQFSQELKQRFGVKVTFRQLIEEVSSVDALISHIASLQSDASSARTHTSPAPADTTQVNHPASAAPSSRVVDEALIASGSPDRTSPQSPPSRSAASVLAPARLPASAPVVTNPPMPAASPLGTSSATTPGASTPIQPPMFEAAPSTTSLSALEQIILQQNALMAQHLSILQGRSVAAPVAGTPVALPPVDSATSGSMPRTPIVSDCGINDDACCRTAPAPSTSIAVVAPAPKPVNKHERFGPYKPVRRGVGNGLTDQQQRHLAGFIDRYTRRTAKSRSLSETSRSHFADPRGVAGYRRIWKSMVYQIAVQKSKGSKLWDIDGNEYIDIAMGFGLNLFGQSPDFITTALKEQLDRGVEVGPQCPFAGDVAQLLCDFARKDRATFCCTGSEAVMAALRLSRTVTGKSKFVFFNKDYHGNFDQVLVRSNRVGNVRRSSPAAPGVPQSFADNAIVLDYCTPEALQVIAERADEIAAVLIEPVQSADPFTEPREFLHEIRRVTRENNIAMIMDEVITGFRAAQGGAQEWFDVWADMSTYGKILGGGMPIGALAGTRQFMDALDGGMWLYDDESEPEADMTFFAGTFVRHPLGLAAAHQVLTMLKEEGPELQQRLTQRTTYLVHTLNRFFESEQFPIRVAQFASQFRFMFPADLEYADMLYFHLLDRGIFTRGWGDNCFLSTAHSDADIERVITAVKESCLEIRSGGFFPEADGEPDKPIHRVNGFAEQKKNSVVSNQQRHEQSIDTLTRNPTAQGLLARDVNSMDDDHVSSLVEIQPEGSRTPLFCTPAADGLTMVYHELSDHLGDDQPVYGLNSPGVLGFPIPDTLEEMAANMIREIKAIQPHGPYLLTGYCSGGTTALEIARQLIDRGDQVAMLAMIETYNWMTAPSTKPSWMTQIGYGIQRVEFHLRNFLLLSWKDKKQFLGSKLDVARRRTKVWRATVMGLFSSKKKRKPTALVNMADIWLKHDQIAEAYVPQMYPGRMIHFRPRRDYRCHLGTELIANEVEYHRLRAYPAGVMVEPFVSELAEKLRLEIDRGMAEFKSAGEECEATLRSREPEALGV